MVVRAPADNPVVTTQRPDFFIGERVEAKMIVTYTGNPDNVNWSMRFEWEDPMGVPIFNETMNMTVYPAPTDRYGAAFSNWTSDMTGVGFTVRGVHISEAKFSEAKFNVSTYSEIAATRTTRSPRLLRQWATWATAPNWGMYHSNGGIQTVQEHFLRMLVRQMGE
jgi:hypothetical protein